jgi:hypothetical protein
MFDEIRVIALQKKVWPLTLINILIHRFKKAFFNVTICFIKDSA